MKPNVKKEEYVKKMSEKYFKTQKKCLPCTGGMAFPRKSGFVSRAPMNNEKKNCENAKKRHNGRK